MKVIFLDVDGVLNSTSFSAYCAKYNFKDWWSYGVLDQDCLLQLKHIIAETDALIVICSSWRTNSSYLALLNQQLMLYGMTIYGTTNTDTKYGRGTQIQQWLDNHEHIESYVILDDDNDIVDYPVEAEITRHLVNTLYLEGLSEKNADEAIRILNGQG